GRGHDRRHAREAHRAPRPHRDLAGAGGRPAGADARTDPAGHPGPHGHWLDWHHRFSPAFGSDPQLARPPFRYVLTTSSADLAVPSPYVTARIQRFGAYATDEIALTPEPFTAHLGIDLAAAS